MISDLLFLLEAWVRTLTRGGWAVVITCRDHDVALRVAWGGSNRQGGVTPTAEVLGMERELHRGHASFRLRRFGRVPCSRCAGSGGLQEVDLDGRPVFTEDPCTRCAGSGDEPK